MNWVISFLAECFVGPHCCRHKLRPNSDGKEILPLSTFWVPAPDSSALPMYCDLFLQSPVELAEGIILLLKGKYCGLDQVTDLTKGTDHRRQSWELPRCLSASLLPVTIAATCLLGGHRDVEWWCMKIILVDSYVKLSTGEAAVLAAYHKLLAVLLLNISTAVHKNGCCHWTILRTFFLLTWGINGSFSSCFHFAREHYSHRF